MKFKTTSILAVILIIATMQNAQAQALEWVKQMGGAQWEEPGGIALDAAGNVFTTGSFQGTVDLDPGPDTFNLTSVSDGDVYITKFDGAGNFIWAKHMGGASGAFGQCIALDVSSNIYVTGTFYGVADFDPGIDTFNLVSDPTYPGYDHFITKLDASGNFVWAKQLRCNDWLHLLSIAVDASENVYTTGYFTGVADFDPGIASFNLYSEGLSDAFVSKLDASGNFVWAKKLGGPDFCGGFDIGIDASGNVITTGLLQGTADFNPGTGTFNLTAAGEFESDIYISKLDSSGNFIWAKQFGGSDYNIGGFSVLDANGNIYITGGFAGTADFDPGNGTFNLTSAGESDIFISKLDPDGKFIWVRQMGGIASDYGNSITLDVSGNVYVEGFFQDIVDFDPGVGTFYQTAESEYDSFIAKINASGNFVWAIKIAATELLSLGSIVLDASDNIYTTGIFIGTADFDPSASIFNLDSEAKGRLFVLNLSQPSVSVVENSFSSKLLAFPNPTTGTLHIVMGENTSTTDIIVRNYLGQQISSKTYPASNQVELMLNGDAGLYFVEIIGDKKRAVLEVVKY